MALASPHRFGLGVNIFFGNVVAITQQALWGRALDYAAVGGGRPVDYGAVLRSGFHKEGAAAFFTPSKHGSANRSLPHHPHLLPVQWPELSAPIVVRRWFARVLMNAPIQGTVPRRR